MHSCIRCFVSLSKASSYHDMNNLTNIRCSLIDAYDTHVQPKHRELCVGKAVSCGKNTETNLISEAAGLRSGARTLNRYCRLV